MKSELSQRKVIRAKAHELTQKIRSENVLLPARKRSWQLRDTAGQIKENDGGLAEAAWPAGEELFNNGRRRAQRRRPVKMTETSVHCGWSWQDRTASSVDLKKQRADVDLELQARDPAATLTWAWFQAARRIQSWQIQSEKLTRDWSGKRELTDRSTSCDVDLIEELIQSLIEQMSHHWGSGLISSPTVLCGRGREDRSTNKPALILLQQTYILLHVTRGTESMLCMIILILY